jgi:8-oxo-dGTP pyrophosphatase MutT (NUDIX family)
MEKPRYMVEVRTLVFVFRGSELLLMEYSGQGTHQSQEKSDRKGRFNPIGGHVEAGEDVAANAIKEAMEEAGVRLENVRIRGVINVSGFAGKNMLNFIVTGTTRDEPVSESLEGRLQWVPLEQVQELNVFEDVKPILDKLLALERGEMIVGTTRFERVDLKDIHLRVLPG